MNKYVLFFMLMISLMFCGITFSQEKASGTKKEKDEKTVDKEVSKKNKAEEEKLAKEKETIKNFLVQLTSPGFVIRVLGLKAIYGTYLDKKISEKTIVPILLERLGDNAGQVRITAFSIIEDVTKEKIERKGGLWKKWWKEKLKKEEEEEEKKKKEAEGDDKAEEESETEEDEEKKKKEEDKEKARERGIIKLKKEHDSTLGYLDRITFTNGRDMECYIVAELKDEDGKTQVYIVKFKGAFGEMPIDASEVAKDGIEYDINKDKFLIPIVIKKDEKKP